MSDSLLELAEGCVKYDFDTVEMIGCKWQLWDEILAALRAAPRCDAVSVDALAAAIYNAEGLYLSPAQSATAARVALSTLSLPAAQGDAESVRAAVIEECAKVAESVGVDEYTNVHRCIANAIRGLAQSAADRGTP